MERLTYQCNSCNTDVSATTTTTTSLLCPRCNSLLPSNNNPNPNINNSNSQLPIPSLFRPSIVTSSDDNFLLDSPYFHRLIHHLTNSNSNSSFHRHSPTSKSAIESIPTVNITSSFLEIDPIILCAICKDQFVINDKTKQLPCKHMYHPDCVLPWLSNHNSCPVCRFELPKEAVSGNVKVRRRSRSMVSRLEDLMEDVDDEAMLGIGFSNLHQHYLETEINPNVMFPLTRIGQNVVVDVLPDYELWGENGVNAGWVDDADVAMP